MNKFFEMHDYTDNMKARIAIFSLKGNVNIWWEHVKRIRDIETSELSWWKFRRIFRKKYLAERYYEGKAITFYELKMESMIAEEYTTKFLELLRYVLYLTNEKAKVQRFFSGLPLLFRDRIKHDEPRSLEEVIGKLKH